MHFNIIFLLVTCRSASFSYDTATRMGLTNHLNDYFQLKFINTSLYEIGPNWIVSEREIIFRVRVHLYQREWKLKNEDLCGTRVSHNF